MKNGMHGKYPVFDHTLMIDERYAVPIRAVDTHRPKPHTSHQAKVVPKTTREYYADALNGN